MSYANDTDRLNAVRQLVEQAGTQLPRHLVDQFYAVAGRPAQAITISLRVTGDVAQARGRERHVEEALAGIASRAGLTVEAGSVRINA